MLNEGLHPSQQAPSVESGAEDNVLQTAVMRLGMPVLIFGGTFFVLIIGLTVLMTPGRFPVHMGEKSVRLSDLESEAQRLERRRAELHSLRASLKQEQRAPILHNVLALSQKIVPTGRVLLLVEEVRSGFRTSSSDPISLPRVEVKGDAATIIIGGDINDVGGRSMQMLAAFVDGLRSIPLITSVSEPEYVSKPTADGGALSPFVLTLTLAP